ncbi:MAG: aspartate--ammonia ligase [Firmicutes bacterium HGW-Firmicutes-21]|nr:MAG: aspartate--ammonia ligase [Firmicutes bacterium HGW-Firmicutes-21]
MSKTLIPKDYKPVLSLYETQMAIGIIKRSFEDKLSAALNIKRVSAPLFVEPATGLNDDLNGTERAVSFDIADAKTDGAVVHSLAKWKRYALYKYGFPVSEGLYTDMNAIRRDEIMDNLHSIYVDQWDWEKVITAQQRNIDFLKEIVRSEVKAMCDTNAYIKQLFPQLTTEMSDQVSFVTTQELEDMYPDLTPREREDAYTKIHKTVFVMKIGGKLKSGIKHDGRAPDYDDWELNGDIIFWNELLGMAFEVSSMGIRVDSASLETQLAAAGAEDRKSMMFHSLLLDGTLPLSIGGGIGQSRFCMLLLGKAHIGEVQVSIWDSETKSICSAAGIELL